MNYFEIAQKLKDAGFPQEVKLGRIVTDPSFKSKSKESKETAPSAYLPSTTELIKACGGDLLFKMKGRGNVILTHGDPAKTKEWEGKSHHEVLTLMYLDQSKK